MKILITILTLISLTLYGAVDRYDNRDIIINVQMIEKISQDLTGKSYVKIYDPALTPDMRSYMSKGSIVASCEQADIVIVNSINQVESKCMNKTVLVTRYNLLSQVEQAVGALYWQKGRPNLLFLKGRLGSRGIALGNDYSPYIEEKLY